jgi:zinc protease
MAKLCILANKIIAMRKIFGFFFSLCFVLQNSNAQTLPKLITSVEGINEYELNNGLRVLLMPDPSQTNIAVNIVYKVGSRHEGLGETGMAHLLEHMLFKQCKKFVDIKKAIADKGAFANGTTWYDRTNYYEILSASDENLRWAIDMEADRMINSKILPTELAKEFSVVRNEFEIGENNQWSVLMERVISSMYLWHNYGKSTIGSKEDVERVRAENLKVFYKKYYQPDNAVLVIAGKFEEKKALQYAQQYFGPIPRPTRKLFPTYTVEPPQDGERNVVLSRTGDINYMALGYHTPPVADKDYAANDALLEILTNNPSGYLYKKLVDTKIATSVGAFAFTLHDPGFTYIFSEVPKDKSIDSAKQVWMQASAEIPNLEITEEDLTRAKNSKLKAIENTMAKTTDFAIELTEYIGAGDWRLYFLNRDRTEKLTVADLKNAAQKYYKTSNRTAGVFIPEAKPDRTVISETPDIAKLLNGYKGKAVTEKKENFENSIANIQKNTEYGKLPNGGRYALLQKPTKGDKINASISLRFGNESSLMNKANAASLLAQILKTGTTNRTKKQISDELDKLKTSISFNGSPNGLGISINTDKANLSAALVLLEDLLKNPRFDEAEFEKLKLENKAGIESNKSDPQYLAGEKLGKLTTNYPKGHPLYASTADEDLEDLSKVTLDDLKQFYANFYGANNSISSFVGELDKPVINSFLQKTFGGWNSKAPFARIAQQHFDVKGKTIAFNTPDKTNAMLLGNININISEKNPDYPAVFMANELLGGGAFLNSRIPQRLRENEGMSYGAGSFMETNYKDDVTKWGVYAMFNPLYKGRLDSALHQEVDKAIQGGFTKDELEKMKSSWLEGNRTTLGDNGTLAGIIRWYMRDDKELSQFTDMEAKVKALTVEQVNAALRKYFDKSKLVMIYAGEFEKGKPAGELGDKKGF